MAAALAWTLAPLEAVAQTEDVTWRNASGVSVSGNDLTKTTSTAWGNSGASSFQTVESNGFVEFSATGNAMLGLSKGDTDQNYADIDFAILIYSGALQVYENGSSRGSFGAVTPSDRFRVEAANGIVRYRKNGVVVYTSTLAARFPLLADAALHATGSTLTDVRIGQTSFSGEAGVTTSEGTLSKTAASGWNAGAVSARRLRWGDGFVEFSAVETDKMRAAGLSNGDTDKTAADIDFAILLNADSTVEVQEAGVSRGSFGYYATGDLFRVEVQDGSVAYLKNGSPFYSSSVAPSYPLWADTALYDTGATLEDVVVSEVLWEAASGVTVSAGTLRKTGSSGWNAGAASSVSIASGDGFVEFTAAETNTTRACGLADQDASYDPAEIDFAIQLQDNADVLVYESGTLRGTFGTYTPGDRFRVEVQIGQVVYRKNGVVFYSSSVTPAYPLRVDAALDTPGATLGDIRLGNLAWKNETGVAVWGYALLKTAGSGWGNSGAVTTVELASGDGAVEYTATDISGSRILGLSKGDSNQNYTDIDFALFAGSGTLYVYEKGSLKGSFGTHAVGDRLRVAVEGGVVKYRRNGTPLYTSAQAIEYPLQVDTALNTSGVALTEIVLSGPFGPGPAAAPAFAPSGGTYTTPPTVTITSSTSLAEIRYTIDGTEPAPSSTLYTAPISVGTTTTLKAKAYRTDLNPSTTTTATYQMSFGTLAAPVMTPGTGVYPASQEFSLTAALGATIRYTTDGTDPTSASPIYSTPLAFQATTTLKAKAYHPDYTTSPTATATYNIKAAAPTLSLPSGTYAAGQAVTVGDPDPSVTIRYTLNGNDPTATDVEVGVGGSLYLGDFTLKVRAFKTGCDPSDVVAATYALSGSLTTAAVAAGTAHTLLLKPDGTLYAWGSNAQGQVGDGTTTARWSPVPVAALTGVVAIAAGDSHSLALRVDGTAWAWGDNYYGQLGDGTSTDRLLPIQVPGLAGGAAVAAGGQHSLLTKSDGSAWSWGGNSYGQLGIGSTTNSLVPAQIPDLQNVVAVVAGMWHSVARRADGSLVAWGRNDNRQLGDGTTTQRNSPVAVSLPATIAAGPSAGASNGLAAASDNVAWGWGSGGSSSLCGLTATAPAAIAGLTVNAVAAGGAFSVFRVLDGTLQACGYNVYGSLGAGSTVGQSSTPLAVVGLTGVESLAAGDGHALAVTPGGIVWGWGRNLNGQIGDGTTVNRNVPVRITETGFQFKAATPVISPLTGTHSAAFNATVSSSTPGATIRYTTNGAEPTEADPIVSGGTVAVGESLTLKARAFKPGLAESNTNVAVYTLVVQAPSLSPGWGSYSTAQNVVVSCPIAGTTARYTTSGQDPTESDPTVACGSALPVDQTQTLKVRGWKSGWSPSSVTAHTYTMVVGTPALAPAGGAYTSAQDVTVTTVTPGATLNFTTDGREPLPTDPVVASGASIAVNHSLSLKVIGHRPGWSDNATATGMYYLVLGTAAAPAFVPPPASYASIQQVHLVSATPGAMIRYTLDGSEPGPSSPVYSAPLTLDADTTVKAMAFGADLLPSAVVTGSYVIANTSTVVAPAFTPPAGRYATQQAVSIASPTSGSTVRYTLDGAEPTPLDPELAPEQTVLVDRAMVLKARAWKAGLADSATQRGFYLVTGALAAGHTHLLALASDGAVWSWGGNGYGQLGDGTTTSRSTPTPIADLSGVVAVAAGENHSLALKADGTVWVWGSNAKGQLGDGTHTASLVPQAVPGLGGVVRIAAGRNHSLAVKADGSAWAWGDNGYGQLGDGTTTQRTSPVQPSGLPPVVALAGSEFHSLALTADGKVWGWGYNYQGQLGDGTFINRLAPVPVVGLSGVSQIGAGRLFSVALKADGGEAGQVWAWGDNETGQLGNSGSADSSLPVIALDDATTIAVGNAHVLAIRLDGTLWAWGDGSGLFGRLGDGARVWRMSPVQVHGLRDAVAVAAGAYYSAAIRAGGGVETWGYNLLGTTSDLPFPVPGLSLAPNAWLSEDGDDDGLTAWDEWRYGTDPLTADTNADGVPDGVAVGLGLSASSFDTDGDGLLNAQELILGTALDRADSDGDGVSDAADCLPLDPTLSTCSIDPGDQTPPTITLLEPPNAIPLP